MLNHSLQYIDHPLLHGLLLIQSIRFQRNLNSILLANVKLLILEFGLRIEKWVR